MESLKKFNRNYTPDELDYSWKGRDFLNWMKSEGFETRTTWEDSYGLTKLAEKYANNVRICTDYYYWAKCTNSTMIRVYVFKIGIVVDFDYDCGGNMYSRFYGYEDGFENAWSNMITDITFEIQR